jgi:hypothetical protein
MYAQLHNLQILSFIGKTPLTFPTGVKGVILPPLLTHILFIQHRIVASRKERRAEERGRGGIKNAESDMHVNNNIKKPFIFPPTNNSMLYRNARLNDTLSYRQQIVR